MTFTSSGPSIRPFWLRLNPAYVSLVVTDGRTLPGSFGYLGSGSHSLMVDWHLLSGTCPYYISTEDERWE
jgi:hypothetical protein